MVDQRSTLAHWSLCSLQVYSEKQRMPDIISGSRGRVWHLIALHNPSVEFLLDKPLRRRANGCYHHSK